MVLKIALCFLGYECAKIRTGAWGKDIWKKSYIFPYNNISGKCTIFLDGYCLERKLSTLALYASGLPECIACDAFGIIEHSASGIQRCSSLIIGRNIGGLNSPVRRSVGTLIS